MTTTLDGTVTAAEDFRSRLLDGLVGSIEARGYRDTTVADIVRHAKTSKRTFYGQFTSKEECFIALLRSNNATMVAEIKESTDAGAAPAAQVRAAVAAYVEHIASHPAVTLSWIREAPALGEAARELHRTGMDQFTELFVAISSGPSFLRAGLRPVSNELALLLLGGIRELTASYVEAGRDVGGIVGPSVTATLALIGLAGEPTG